MKKNQFSQREKNCCSFQYQGALKVVELSIRYGPYHLTVFMSTVALKTYDRISIAIVISIRYPGFRQLPALSAR